MMIILLVVLYFFNNNLRWDGISLIIRSYIFIFSFYVIFNFSLIDINFHYESYKEKYNSLANYMLFFITRLVPFLFIYFLTVLFALVEYTGKGNWPERPIIELINGRYSNILVYSLILLIILRIKKPPKITIPLFFILSVFYLFILDKLIYSFVLSGIIISLIKIFKFISVVFFLSIE